jgi:hypothetical protein
VPQQQLECGAGDSPNGLAHLCRKLREEVLGQELNVLAAIPKEVRDRLRDAVALVYNPDSRARRQMVKATIKQRKAAAVRKEEEILEERGIRALRRKSGLKTPNVFPPERFEPSDVDDPDFSEAVEERHRYVCKERYTTLHHFYYQLCPTCGDDRNQGPCRCARAAAG